VVEQTQQQQRPVERADGCLPEMQYRDALRHATGPLSVPIGRGCLGGVEYFLPRLIAACTFGGRHFWGCPENGGSRVRLHQIPRVHVLVGVGTYVSEFTQTKWPTAFMFVPVRMVVNLFLRVSKSTVHSFWTRVK